MPCSGLLHQGRPSSSDRLGWIMFGRSMCKVAFAGFLNIGHTQFDRLLKAVEAGHSMPFEDGRVTNGRPRAVQYDVDSFFMYLYEYVAEPLAETVDDDKKQGSCKVQGQGKIQVGVSGTSAQ